APCEEGVFYSIGPRCQALFDARRSVSCIEGQPKPATASPLSDLLSSGAHSTESAAGVKREFCEANRKIQTTTTTYHSFHR
ncbi:hypothetical protein, partial [Billgrantia kenyensis]|uniref:hypothetical protein n=1 Tax=Billgrantia kenyensis TaxID=321266 RepID=UPI001C68683A